MPWWSPTAPAPRAALSRWNNGASRLRGRLPASRESPGHPRGDRSFPAGQSPGRAARLWRRTVPLRDRRAAPPAAGYREDLGADRAQGATDPGGVKPAKVAKVQTAYRAIVLRGTIMGQLCRYPLAPAWVLTRQWRCSAPAAWVRSIRPAIRG
ncbi:hypothetical protein SBA6_300040 [Candidatus Sulfopaludibacter sp. SbA6]|nr:hypothetical protein SBA6_300040 [Candidatus Sulfopaludibacter sp. SbA6]